MKASSVSFVALIGSTCATAWRLDASLSATIALIELVAFDSYRSSTLEIQLSLLLESVIAHSDITSLRPPLREFLQLLPRAFAFASAPELLRSLGNLLLCLNKVFPFVRLHLPALKPFLNEPQVLIHITPCLSFILGTLPKSFLSSRLIDEDSTHDEDIVVRASWSWFHEYVIGALRVNPTSPVDTTALAYFDSVISCYMPFTDEGVLSRLLSTLALWLDAVLSDPSDGDASARLFKLLGRIGSCRAKGILAPISSSCLNLIKYFWTANSVSFAGFEGSGNLAMLRGLSFRTLSQLPSFNSGEEKEIVGVVFSVCCDPNTASDLVANVIKSIPLYLARLHSGSVSDRSTQAKVMARRLVDFINHADPAVQVAVASATRLVFCMLAFPTAKGSDFTSPECKERSRDFDVCTESKEQKASCPDCDRDIMTMVDAVYTAPATPLPWSSIEPYLTMTALDRHISVRQVMASTLLRFLRHGSLTDIVENAESIRSELLSLLFDPNNDINMVVANSMYLLLGDGLEPSCPFVSLWNVGGAEQDQIALSVDSFLADLGKSTQALRERDGLSSFVPPQVATALGSLACRLRGPAQGKGGKDSYKAANGR